MTKTEIQATKDYVLLLEENMNEIMLEVADRETTNVMVHVMLNVSTSLLAKALVLINEEHRQTIVHEAITQIFVKVQEGEATLHSHLALEKAKIH